MILVFSKFISCYLLLFFDATKAIAFDGIFHPVNNFYREKSINRYNLKRRDLILETSSSTHYFSKFKERLKQIFKFLDSPEVELEEDLVHPSCPPLEVFSSQNKSIEKEIKITREEIVNPLKNQEDLDKYFSCYQRDEKFSERYQKKIREDIAHVIKHYNDSTPEHLRTSHDEVRSLFSCLIFRESYGWKNMNSHTGARGIAQFTSVAVRYLKRILSDKYESEEEIDAKIKEFQEQYEKSDRKDFIKENINYLENKKKLNERMKIMQDYWNKLEIPNKPNISDIDMDYVFNLSNSTVVLHLSMLMIIDCQVSYTQENIQHLDSTSYMSFLACTGAYNMGKWGFYENALSKVENDGKVMNWIDNLRDSTSTQKKECIQHLISIYRCIQKDTNYPMCGTNNNYCENFLSSANNCKDKDIFQCHPKECP